MWIFVDERLSTTNAEIAAIATDAETFGLYFFFFFFTTGTMRPSASCKS